MALGSFQLAQQACLGDDVYVLRLGSNCDGTALAAATSDNAVCLLDPATLAPVRRLEGHADSVEDLGFFQADPQCLASCSRDGTACIWDLRAAEAARKFSLGSVEASSCSVGRGDTALACAASEKIHLFDIGQGKRLTVYKDCHTDVVNHVRFHPADTSKLLSGAEDNLIVLLDTDARREDEALMGVISNDECVRSFTLVGPDRNTLCCASTTEDVRVFNLHLDTLGTRTGQVQGVMQHPLLMREDSFGYVVETFYDQPSGQVFLLAGAGNEGDLMLFHVTLEEAVPVATFVSPGGGHTGIVRSAVCLPGGVVLTSGEDSRVCAWREGPAGLADAAAGPAAAAQSFDLEPTGYRARRSGGGARAAPY